MESEYRRIPRRSLLGGAAAAAFITACGGNPKEEDSKNVISTQTVSQGSGSNDLPGNREVISGMDINVNNVTTLNRGEVRDLFAQDQAKTNQETASLILPIAKESLPVAIADLERVLRTGSQGFTVERYLGFTLKEGTIITAPYPGIAVSSKSQEQTYHGEAEVISFVTNFENQFNFTFIVGGNIEMLLGFDGNFQGLPATQAVDVGVPLFRIKSPGTFRNPTVANIEKDFPNSKYDMWLVENKKTREKNYAPDNLGRLVGSDLTIDRLLKKDGKFVLPA